MSVQYNPMAEGHSNEPAPPPYSIGGHDEREDSKAVAAGTAALLPSSAGAAGLVPVGMTPAALSGALSAAVHIDDPHLKQCRICLDEGGPDLIAPCRCRGSAKWVHRSCLDRWRATQRDGKAFTNCRECNFTFVVSTVPVSESEEQCRRIKYTAFVARDTIGLFVVIQLIIAVLGAMAYAVDGSDQPFRHMLTAAVSRNAVASYYCIGLVLFFAVIGFVAMIGWCCGHFRDESGLYGYRQDPCLNCGGFCYIGDCGARGQGHGGDCSGCAGCHCPCAGSGGGGGGGSGDGAAFCLLVVAVVVILLALIGVVVGVFLASVFMQRVMQRHFRVLWLSEEVKRFVVCDMDGKDLDAAAAAVVAAQATGTAPGHHSAVAAIGEAEADRRQVELIAVAIGGAVAASAPPKNAPEGL